MQSDASTPSPDSIREEDPLWESTPPTSLAAPISPPQLDSTRPAKRPKRAPSPSLAAVEAGEAEIDDHLAYFTKHLSRVLRPCAAGVPRLSIAEFRRLYEQNSDAQGHHFVIHQHDHPVAGVHYDLRLQFSESSSISFAIPFGVPGDANSVRMGRMAMETRVHNFWNHLIESASHATGSLLIWDTGEYSILPSSQPPSQRKSKHSSSSDSDCGSDSSPTTINQTSPENEKLQQAFRTGKFRLRLHGTRLPQNYTVVLRLTDLNYGNHRPANPAVKRKRRRRRPDITHGSTSRQETPPSSSSSSSDRNEEPPANLAAPPATSPNANANANTSALQKELAEQEDERVRLTNAYPGAANTIGSVHQRSWHLSLDKASSGFVRVVDGKGGRGTWVRSGVEKGKDKGFEAFYVRGREVERSVLTGRRASEVCTDEGVVGFVVRKGWRAVLE